MSAYNLLKPCPICHGSKTMLGPGYMRIKCTNCDGLGKIPKDLKGIKPDPVKPSDTPAPSDNPSIVTKKRRGRPPKVKG